MDLCLSAPGTQLSKKDVKEITKKVENSKAGLKTVTKKSPNLVKKDIKVVPEKPTEHAVDRKIEVKIDYSDRYPLERYQIDYSIRYFPVSKPNCFRKAKSFKRWKLKFLIFFFDQNSFSQ